MNRLAVRRLWLSVAAVSLLGSIGAGLGCRQKEEAATSPGPSGSVYYTGPMKPKGSPSGPSSGTTASGQVGTAQGTR
jgi:hypothetical protein